MIDKIEEFYEEHPILFQIIALPFELLIGIPAGITIANWTINFFS